ncbi:MAG: hypothetical protein MUP85_02675 [Candidatus Lokiarchaeota archaeon]|nr:hypothetical protein [Candidatus Lokiarchaeota archaeon]
MRKEIIAIGILAMIAVCATLAMADTPPSQVNISELEDKVVFLNAAESEWTIKITSEETSEKIILIEVPPAEDITGFAYFVEFGECTGNCNEMCNLLSPGEYTVKVYDSVNKLAKEGIITI